MSPVSGRDGVIRVVLLLGGGLATAYGALLLLDRPDDLVGVALWLGGGVLAHDALLAPLVIAGCAAGVALLPVWARGPVAGGLVVLGSVTLLAVPVLGRFGARQDNATLLDRSYGAGWLLLAGLTCAVVGLLLARAWWRVRSGGSGESSGTGELGRPGEPGEPGEPGRRADGEGAGRR